MTMRNPRSRRWFLAIRRGLDRDQYRRRTQQAVSEPGRRPPLITHGVESGDVSVDAGVIWPRTDLWARTLAEVATTDSFKTIHGAVFVDALPESDFMANVLIDGLPAGQDIATASASTICRRRRSSRSRDRPFSHRAERPALDLVRVVGRYPLPGPGHRRGARRHADLRDHAAPPSVVFHRHRRHHRCRRPDPRRAENAERGDRKNVVSEDKAKVAETLAEFRGNDKYNLTDKHMLAFNAAVPIFAQWDDHEVTNNWWPGEPLTRAVACAPEIHRENTLILAARAGRAFHEYMPLRRTQAEAGRIYRKISYGPLLDVFMIDMRSYRGPNGEGMEDSYGPAAYFLGPAQVAWLKRELINSQATWKVIAADMPISLIVYDDFASQKGVEAVAQGDGPARGRELEIADLLAFIKRAGIRNTLWLTADVHYTAAHHYDPNRAVFQDFEPFWEFVSGPLHAGSFPQNKLDNTFGPQLMYVKAPSAAEPAAERRPAILRSGRHRRRHPGHDRDAQGRRGPRAVVDQARAEAGVTGAVHPNRAAQRDGAGAATTLSQRPKTHTRGTAGQRDRKALQGKDLSLSQRGGTAGVGAVPLGKPARPRARAVIGPSESTVGFVRPKSAVGFVRPKRPGKGKPLRPMLYLPDKRSVAALPLASPPALAIDTASVSIPRQCHGRG